MTKNFFSLLLFFISLFSYSQEAKFPSPSEFFPDQRSEVMVLGTIHFDYPELDAIKTNDGDRLDILSAEKQREINELINYIKKFQPTKIVIEAWDSFNATGKLRRYKTGEYRNERSERFQIGMRLAAELGLDTLYSIDAEPLIADLAEVDSTYVKNLAEDFDYQSNDHLHKISIAYFKAINKLPAKMNLLEYFKALNSKQHLHYVFGSYLTGDFKLDDQRGADVFSIWWYNRNLRIFRKLQELNKENDDRILVIFGVDHAAILNQLIDSSPEFHLIEFGSL